MIPRILRSFLNTIENLKFLIPNAKVILALFIFGFLAICIGVIMDNTFILQWGLTVQPYAILSSIVSLKWGENTPTWGHYMGIILFLVSVLIITFPFVS